jgi:hypothetical protein
MSKLPCIFNKIPFNKQEILPGGLFHFSMPEQEMGMKRGHNQDAAAKTTLRVQATAHPDQGLGCAKQGRGGKFPHGQDNRCPGSGYFPLQMGKTLLHGTRISDPLGGGAFQNIGYICPVRLYIYGLHHPPEHLILFTITPERIGRGSGPAPVSQDYKLGGRAIPGPGRQERSRMAP